MDAMKVDFVKYNRDRLPQYRTETTVWSSPQGRRVRKRALSEEGRAHVRNIMAGAELLQRKLPDANLPRMVPTEEGVELDYIEGAFLEDALLQRAAEGDREGFLDSLERFRCYLASLGTSDERSLRGVVRDLLSGVPEGPLTDMMPVANLDLTFDNVIVDGDGRHWIIDHEWIFDSPVPRSFILYRSLYVLYLKQERRLAHLISFPEALMEAGVEEGLWEPYREACEGFIDLVLGQDRPHVIPPGYRKEVQQLASLAHLQSREQQLYAARLELEATKAALDEMMAHSRLREERLQGQEKRLGELTDALEGHKSSLAEKEGSLESLRVELESERLRASALRAQLEMERDHAFKLIEELEGERLQRDRLAMELEGERSQRDQLAMELEGERDRKAQILKELEREQALTKQLQEGLRLLQEDLRVAQEVLAMDQATIIDLIRSRDDNFVRLQDMTERFISKQAELMTMSDWARSMQLRLDFLESIPTIRFTERVARNQRSALDRLRSDGMWPTLKDVTLKAAPRKVQQMFYHQDPSNMEELETDTRERDVLVVLPVIPWEFRWQRPQQMVSRFAENGYTVIFVNMTLTPKGARYLNDGEALGDVKIGRLRKHVYEAHLCSFGKLNVYHDRIRGADLNNITRGLLAVLRRLQPRSFTYLVQFPGWGQLALLVRSRVPGTVVFDCMDDHAGFRNNAAEVVKRETRLMEKADLVVTSSAKLHEKATMFNDNTLLVRNGTDFDMFHALSPNGKLGTMRRPVIGYHGAISEWFDPEVVARCADRHPGWSFVLIGSTLGCDVNGLKRLPNVHLLGEMPYKDLPGYLYYFDVCMIPFRVCELTLATNPVKFYEYISSGKPVVSVRLPEMEQYADICYLYEGDREFEEGIAQALAEKDADLVAKRIEVARNSSWDQRFQDVKNRLDEMQKQESGERILRLLRRRSPED